MKLLAISTMVALMTGSCQSGSTTADQSAAGSKTNPVADLEQKIMIVHDSLMPQVSDILKLKKQVGAKLATATDKSVKQQGETIRQQLDEADQGMMGWMNQYNGDTLGKLDQAKAIEYLNDQQKKVNAVRNQMHKSIADAQKYVQ